MTEAVAFVALGLFVICAGMNLFVLVRNSIKRDRYVSMIPLLGGVSGMVGCLLIPALRYHAWLPLFLDLGTALMLLGGLPVVLKELWGTRSANLISEYVACSAGQHVRLRLFRGQLFVMVQTWERNGGETGFREISTCGSWSLKDDKLLLKRGNADSVLSFADADGARIRVVVDFPGEEANHDMSLASFTLTLDKGQSVLSYMSQ